MTFKPRKSRFLILRRGKVWQKITLRVQGEDIPSLIDNPVKCLGKWFDTTLLIAEITQSASGSN